MKGQVNQNCFTPYSFVIQYQSGFYQQFLDLSWTLNTASVIKIKIEHSESEVTLWIGYWTHLS